jgi:hypothetical protein
MKTLEEIAEEFLIRQGCQRMDCDGENCNFFEDVQPKDLIEFAKWQQERMYSEEEIIEILHSRMRYTLGKDYKEVTTIEWFEQFKKK